jgi:hypothetical protein
MRILVYTPIRTGQLFGRALQSILRLEWDGQLDVLFARGGETSVTADHASAPDRNAAYAEVTRKYNLARDAALRGGYDALLCAESDMILPPDALTKLARVDADVAYGLYSLRHGDHRWSAFSVVSGLSGISLSRNAKTRAATWGKCVEVAGVGMGCTLIHRRVLEALPFRVVEGGACCDWYLSLDCQERGFRQMCNLSVVCGHMHQATSGPRVLWPEPTKGLRIEMIDAHLTPLAPGERREYVVGLDTLIVPGEVARA